MSEQLFRAEKIVLEAAKHSAGHEVFKLMKINGIITNFDIYNDLSG